jgi:hypothetical protein
MRDPLNFFEPYESLPPTHENQLTRAFLVTLRLVPIAHAAWLRMVSDAREGAKSLPPLERCRRRPSRPRPGRSARHRRPRPVWMRRASTERYRSYKQGGCRPTRRRRGSRSAAPCSTEWCATGTTSSSSSSPSWTAASMSGRLARLRSARPPGDWTPIGQGCGGATSSRPGATCSCGISCREASARCSRTSCGSFSATSRDCSPSPSSARVVAADTWSDFAAKRSSMSWVLSRLSFERLVHRQPHRQVQACFWRAPIRSSSPGWSQTMPRPRCRSNCFLATPSSKPRPSTPTQTESANCSPSATRVGQSPRTSTSVTWRRGFVWTTGDIGVEKYVRYWLEHIGTAGQVRRKDCGEFFDRLITLHIASEADRENFDRNFPQTKRRSATPRPGLAVERSWPFESAAELDRAHRFGYVVHDSINMVLRALGEPAL